MTNEVSFKGSHQLSFDISTITAEINAYKQIAGEAIFEIGRRLKHVKSENMAKGYGGWSRWCEEEVGMDRAQADKFIRVFDEIGSESTYTQLGLNALYLIATIPPKQREQTHVTEKGEEKKPEEMTVRELQELKRQLRAEKAERERLEQVNEELAKVADKPPEVITEYKTEYIEVRDEEAERRLREYERRFGDISNYDESITASNRQDMIVAVGSFTSGLRDFAKRHAYLSQYKEVIANLDDSHKQSYNESVLALKELADLFEMTNGEVIIINQ